MQTFMPLPSFYESAKVLDYKRLGKQRVEAYQILRILLGEVAPKGYLHHPAVLMWRGHEGALALYGMAMCKEWKERGYKDSLFEKFANRTFTIKSLATPEWFGKDAFHSSHRAILLDKNNWHYRQFGWLEKRASKDPKTKSYPYFWPVKKETTLQVIA